MSIRTPDVLSPGGRGRLGTRLGAGLVDVVGHTDIHYLDGERGTCKWDVDQTYILYRNTFHILSQY